MLLLTDLPFDVIQLIASLLLPYDIVALSETCHILEPLLIARTVWLQVADSISRSRPLPYTAAQALDLPIEELIQTCLRAERIASHWAQEDIRTCVPPIKISFPDKRLITYFTFLPGTRHLVIYDVQDFLSCWTTDGELLESWRVEKGAKLIRWKPCDESESSYDFKSGHAQAVEILIELPRHTQSTQYEIILLVYYNSCARFETIRAFNIPRIYEPLSAMTQDELLGSLVGINPWPHEHVGIYLTDKNTKKAVCIDTGLNLVVGCVPRALLSPSHVVLYWETLSAAHTVTYELDLLRFVLAKNGRSQDDVQHREPVIVPPPEVRAIPFRTVSTSLPEDSVSSRPTRACQGCGTHLEDVLPSTDLSRNRDVYPVIIPKWHTLRDDLRRHRPRSVLTFSRCPQYMGLQAPTPYVNMPNLDLMHILGDNNEANPNLTNDAPAADENNHVFHEDGLSPLAGAFYDNHQHTASSFPRTTITHHYFDYIGSTSGSRSPELVRTVLTEATLRRSQSLRIPQHHVHAVLMEEGASDEDEDEEDEDGEEDSDSDGNENDLDWGGFGIEQIEGYHNVGDDAFHEGNGDDGGLVGLGLEYLGDHSGAEEAILHDENNLYEHENGYGNGYNLTAHHIDEAGAFGELTNPENGTHDLGLELGDLATQHILAGPAIFHLDEDATQALEDFVQEPFGGSPVMGYGGRCAIWVEEYPRKYRANGRAPVLRVATFPTYKPEPEPLQSSRNDEGFVYPELEVARGRVGTLRLPPCISLEGAYSFDLDDTRGVVGIATSFGELWLVDFS